MRNILPAHFQWNCSNLTSRGNGMYTTKRRCLSATAVIAAFIFILYSFPFPVLYLTGGSLSNECKWQDFTSVPPRDTSKHFNWEEHLQNKGIALNKDRHAYCEVQFEDKAKQFPQSFHEAYKKFNHQLGTTRWVFPVEGNTGSYLPIQWIYWAAASHPGEGKCNCY